MQRPLTLLALLYSPVTLCQLSLSPREAEGLVSRENHTTAHLKGLKQGRECLNLRAIAESDVRRHHPGMLGTR